MLKKLNLENCPVHLVIFSSIFTEFVSELTKPLDSMSSKPDLTFNSLIVIRKNLSPTSAGCGILFHVFPFRLWCQFLVGFN